MTAVFKRFAKKEKIQTSSLIRVIANADNGLIDADLGGGVIKQRIARKGQGKSGGYRSLIAFKQGNTSFFMYGFAKNERSNISAQELADLRKLASVLLNAKPESVQAMLDDNVLTEVILDE